MSSFVRTFKRRKLFLDQLAVGDSISRAATIAGGTVRQFRRWRDTDSSFAQDWDDALEEGTDFIEDAATDRALRKSDALMAMILKARRPDKYDRGGKLELSGDINVTGAKQKLLNRIARLQAEGQLLQSTPEPESEIPQKEDETEPEKQLLLPAPPENGRGFKRRAAAGNRR